jgi:glycosyltransferase involved in cell wall biosynthesis
MEAMAMEKTVIVSSVKAMCEMVDHRRTGLVFEKDNTTDLALKLEEVISNKVMMRQLGKNARLWVTSNRTWEIMGNKVKAWIDAE